MKLNFTGTEIRISATVLIMPALMLIAGLFREYTVILFSMLLHESGHIAAAGICGIRTDALNVSVLGFSAEIPISSCSKKELIFIYSAGPSLNLIIFIAVSMLGYILPCAQGYLELVSVSNLFMGLFNLLPVIPLDGGRLIYELLSGGIGSRAAGRTVRLLAWIISSLMIAAGVYQLLITTFNISLVVIGLYIMIAMRTARLESALMSIREIIYRRSRLVRRGIYPARDLVAMRDTLLRESLKSMDFDRFHIVYVLDDDLHIVGTYTENEIMDVLTEHNEELTFGQLVDMQKNAAGQDSEI